ncbi:phosphatidate cytidylyltransferase [Fulvivirgaceae bacterium PWU4]|uniref:Phosphatidate cytidylyltransferase n=1 Tax=Chryseosolibacter histidini TaxID=2782349 RepID=A0AAP2GM68_9BACT|nr:phosphatidate cytidylyltransferase [Chryseosolibacter histidini]MBT1701196.1 phosphatidate cytidylyltransferase [Chryseosolibacter histidini]
MTSSLKKYSNLTQRIITGLLGSAGIIAAICYSPWTYFAVFFFICTLALWEFYKLAGLDGLAPQKVFGTFCGILVFVLSFLIEMQLVSYRYYFLIFPLISFVYMIKLYKKFERKPFTNIAFTFLGIFYVAVPFALLNIAAFENGHYHYQIIFGCLFILWASDTGAYFAGTFFGKRKLFERISPKKSWEGFFGGAALAMAFAVGLPFFFESIGQQSTLSLIDWIIVGLIIIVGGTFGDLVESLLKRSIEIKDSGDSLPGHGGFLDRFDGLLISAPFIVAYIEIF